MKTKRIKRKKNFFKKILPLVIFVAICIDIIFFIGLHKNYGKVLKESIDKMKKLDNYSVNTFIDFLGLEESNRIIINQKNNEKEKVYFYSIINKNYNTKIYKKIDDNGITIYQFDDNNGEWNVSIENSDNELNKEFYNVIRDFNDVKKVKSDIDNLEKYKIVVDINKLIDIDYTGSLKELYDNNKDIFPNKVNAYVYINKQKYITNVLIDLTGKVEKLNTSDGKTYDNLIIKIKYSSFNTDNNIKIPNNIKKDTLEIDENGIMDNKNTIYNEEQIMNDIAVSATLLCKNITIDFSKYNGELNEYLSLNNYSIKSITSGKIKIDNECNIEVIDDFIINGKKCNYTDELYESCK